MNDKTGDVDAELEAMRVLYVALKDLEPAAQNRVLKYVMMRLSLTRDESEERAGSTFSPRELAQEREEGTEETTSTPTVPASDELEGVSPVAQKWVRRNGLSSA